MNVRVVFLINTHSSFYGQNSETLLGKTTAYKNKSMCVRVVFLYNSNKHTTNKNNTGQGIFNLILTSKFYYINEVTSTFKYLTGGSFKEVSPDRGFECTQTYSYACREFKLCPAV